MHHPHQFNVMAKSIQDDRLRAAAESRVTRKAQARRFSWRVIIARPFRQIGIKRVASWAAASFGQLVNATTQAAYEDN